VQKTGHFHFALTGIFLAVDIQGRPIV